MSGLTPSSVALRSRRSRTRHSFEPEPGIRGASFTLAAVASMAASAARAAPELALLDSLPGPNEPNWEGRAIGDWAQRTRWAMQALWEETRKRVAFDDVLVQGPR